MTYVVSDIHGCLDKFNRLLREIRFTDNDCVGFGVFNDFPVEEHCLHFFFRGRAVGYYLYVFFRKKRFVVVLYQKTAVYFLHIVSGFFSLYFDIGKF